MNFADTLNRLQMERGETNYRLAKSIGVTQTSIANWKTGVKPHPRHVKMLEVHYRLKDGQLSKLLKSERKESVTNERV